MTTLLTRNAALVVWSGVLTTTLEGLVYLASVPSPRPLIQLAAEGMGATAALPASLRQAPMYRTAWQILTAIWGGVSLSKAGVFVLAQGWLPLDTALLVVCDLAVAGTQHGPFPFPGVGILPPTGKPYAIKHCHWFRVADGKITEHWAVRDDLGHLTLPTPPAT